MAKDFGNVVIVGGGIIGCSVAYHLAELGVASTVIERCAIACGASGKAGGFLARTWCDEEPVGPLARASYDLHKKYGCMFDTDYRPLESLEVVVDERKNRSEILPLAPDWIDQKSVLSTAKISDSTGTAQIHPEKLSKCFMKAAQEKGAKVIIGQVVGVEFSPADTKSVTAVKVKDQESVPCDLLILTMGPWTNSASQWFQYHLPQISAERVHGIIIKPERPISAHALFVEYTDAAGDKYDPDPELYPRPDGTAYFCGFHDREALPESADEVAVDRDSVNSLQSMVSKISSSLAGGEVVTETACYMPQAPGDIPVIGLIPDSNGQVYIAAGHYCWGILNAPATGKSLAELIVNGHSEVDLSPFDPALFV